MAVSIFEVSVTPQTVKVGEPVTINIWAEDTDWYRLSRAFVTWEDLINYFADCQALKDYMISCDVLYDAESEPVYDVDGNRIYVYKIDENDTCRTDYTCAEINVFVAEVNNDG